MAHKKIIITQTQSSVIHKLLKADKGDEPLQELIDKIAKEAEVETWIADRMASAWRWNHNGEGAVQNEEAKDQHFLVQTPMPKKTDADPSNGSGKVAQIISLAAEGKSVAQIIEMGYNKSTVYRQVSEWRKRTKEAAAK